MYKQLFVPFAAAILSQVSALSVVDECDKPEPYQAAADKMKEFCEKDCMDPIARGHCISNADAYIDHMMSHWCSGSGVLPSCKDKEEEDFFRQFGKCKNRDCQNKLEENLPKRLEEVCAGEEEHPADLICKARVKSRA